MPGIVSARRRPFNTRPRNSTTPRRRATVADDAANFTEPPPKRRRYVPGGPGGGGHYLDDNGAERHVGGRDTDNITTSTRRRNGTMKARSAVATPTHERPRRASQRERTRVPKPRYSSAAAASAAMVNGDGFKPREERGWEEFHQDLEIEADMPVFSADEVDGVVKASTPLTPGSTNGTHTNGEAGGSQAEAPTPSTMQTPARRGPGRPPRNRKSMIQGLGTPDTPKAVPPPGPNPREKLTLPKPSFRLVDTFSEYEKPEENGKKSIDYVDKSMAKVGYQESEIFIQPSHYVRQVEGGMEEDLDLHIGSKADEEPTSLAATVKRVEYDMDEQDEKFLEEYNEQRVKEDAPPLKPAVFEIVMSYIEKEWYALEKRIPKPNPKPPQTHRPRSSSAAAVNGEAGAQGEEQDSKCAICDDGDCENTNAIVFCDGCDLAVHQECYGVPFIPEGQWLCRKCHLIGSGTPTCIFCPNTDGAFKQTNSSKWSHLLCAIWIPEVSLGNTTFMEPVMDVEKVPKPRWRLTCSICNQKMGACIQCGNKNCFRAFHVTCGRRAKWFLSMKSSHGGPASLDASVLKAYCDKHVPDEWSKANDVDGATAEAMRFYRRFMKGKVWADDKQIAASIQANHKKTEDPLPSNEQSSSTITLSPNKRRKVQIPKNTWKLPSGAPVIPAVIYEAVETLLHRLTIRQKKQFAEDMCKYWTLKREARRGAALIKRLQLQMEMFSSMEITRRDFASMGAAGGPRLRRRKSFTKILQQDGEKLKDLAQQIVERQRLQLDDDIVLDGLVDTVYFPMCPLLRPIMDKALSLNGKGYFRDGLMHLYSNVDRRFYTSVEPFYKDLALVLGKVVVGSSAIDLGEVLSQIVGDRGAKKDMTVDQKEMMKVARRIIKSIRPDVEEALRNEADLVGGEPTDLNRFEILDTTLPFDLGFVGAAGSVAPSVDGLAPDKPAEVPVDGDGDVYMGQEEVPVDPALEANGSATTTSKESHPTSPQFKAEHPPTPPLSSNSHHKSDVFVALTQGGVPSYMEGFEPRGTTISYEQWPDRDAMSEELSDMDEEELIGLVSDRDDMELDTVRVAVAEADDVKPEKKVPVARKKAAAARSRKKGGAGRR